MTPASLLSLLCASYRFVPLRFTCPACGQSQENISSRFLGKRIQCRCGQVVRLGPKLTTAAPTQSPKTPRETTNSPPGTGASASVPDSQAGRPRPSPAIPEFAPPPETVERMFGKRAPLPRSRHQSPALNPVGTRENPFRDGVENQAVSAPDPATEMMFPPLDVPVAVTPVVVALPYDIGPRPLGISAYLSLCGGIFGSLQGVAASLLTLYLMLKLGTLWLASSSDSLGLTGSQRDTIQSQLLIDLLLLGILLLMNVGLAVAAGLQLISSIFETRRETPPQPQPSVNTALVAGLYLALLIVLMLLYYFTQPAPTAGILPDYTRSSLFGPFTGVQIALACLAIVPTLLINLGVLRSRE